MMSFKKPSDKDFSWKSDKNSSRRSSQEEKKDEKSSLSLSQTLPVPMKPMILMKPQPNKPQSSGSQGDNSNNWQEVSSSPTAPVAPKLAFSISSSHQNDKKPSVRTDTKLKNTSRSSSVASSGTASSESPKNTGNVPRNSIKMIDSTLHWVEAGIDTLQDQSDFLVVGVIGLQGVGKSTIMSMLANAGQFIEGKNAIFREQTTEQKERAAHMTSGVDFTVTHDRVILIDTQPILSASVLEQLIDLRKNSDFSGNPSIQMQSLQLATFILTVCHVVIVVQDYFTDSNVYSFLKKAEMVKPPTPVPHDSSSSDRKTTELQPVIVFVHNKLESNMFSIRNICIMNTIIGAHTKFSGLHCKGQFSLLDSELYPGLDQLVQSNNEINQFLFPHFKDREADVADGQELDEEVDLKRMRVFDQSDAHFLDLPQFRNRPEFSHMAEYFYKMILAIPRHSITHQILTEKTWFHYAARSWEAIKKSQGLMEFSRLIST